MNIPRQFYGMNYMSKMVNAFQDFELNNTPAMKYTRPEGIKSIPLPGISPREAGIRTECILQFISDLANNPLCAMDGIAIAKGEKLLLSAYRPPFRQEIGHITNSTCKTLTAIAVMFAVSENLLSEDDEVLSFFPEYDNVLTPRNLRKMTIRHLLTMESGSKTSEYISLVEEDWTKAFLLTDCQCEPGSKFIYNSMNTYMLASILVKVAGKGLVEYLTPRFFEPLGIGNVRWELCPMGIERGGWGLHISLPDMVKLGIFLSQNGSFHGKQLIPAKYIIRMKETCVSQNADELSVGYGYQLWHLPKGRYMTSGMYGQHIIIDEKHQLVVAMNAHSDKLFPDCPATRRVLEFMESDLLYTPENAMVDYTKQKRLQICLQAFSKGYKLPSFDNTKKLTPVYLLQQEKKENKKALETKRLLKQLEYGRIHVDQATFKLFPYIMQGMYGYPSFQVSDLLFKVTEECLKIAFIKGPNNEKLREKLILNAGYNSYINQLVQIGKGKTHIAAKAFAAKDEDDHPVLILDLVFPAQGFSRLIKVFLLEEHLAIECMEFPNMRGIIEQVLYGDTSLGGTTIDLTDKIPESLRVLLDYKVEPRVYAKQLN